MRCSKWQLIFQNLEKIVFRKVQSSVIKHAQSLRLVQRHIEQLLRNNKLTEAMDAMQKILCIAKLGTSQRSMHDHGVDVATAPPIVDFFGQI